MSVVSNNILAGASGQGGDGYEIERSLRFNSADTPKITRTPSSAGNQKTWTLSFWMKRTTTGSREQILSAAGTHNTYVEFQNDKLMIEDHNPGLNFILKTTRVFRDHSSWYSVIVSVDTTQATASNRIKLYINGVQETAFDSSTYPSQNYDTSFNDTGEHKFGQFPGNTSFPFNGYLADVHFIDGQALAPTDFGEIDDNGVWQPKKFEGTYNAPASFPSYPHVTINPTALGSGSDISHINGGGNYFFSNAASGAGSVKVVFENPITGVTNIKYNGGAYSVNALYNIKINGTDVFTNLGTASGWGQVSHTISSTDISSFEIYTANDGWSLYNLLFNDTSPSGTASLGTTAGVNGFHLPFTDNS